ncbi:hypothetical protein A2Z33_06690 [Candidatus Gottesmanbacteria bacterium RBG_16_52_11]|uniref:Flavodoxin-like domain-containing protein n=1 Tax=Candidatus Gottesmanbacteria bacterium RBG_16_52_11 TaxID=1798374 RepID=A0A1F5YXY1_9BACT|nr:MAG: hypothetical protein A2Z33_06690 [Candidatus Gottesmanbacteria bacterium RBG_16_52_11]
MNILVIFATYSGGTQIASATLAEALKAEGHSVTVKGPAETQTDELVKSDAVVLCTPTWDFEGKEGQPHEDYVGFMEKTKGASLEGMPFAVLALGDSSYTHFCGSAEVLEAYVTSVGGILKVPSLKIDGYFFSQEKHTGSIREWAKSFSGTLSSK